MALDVQISKRNFRAFLWHSIFFALAKNFMDVDTVIPAMLIESGGQAMHIGILTTIMLGGSGFMQLFFAPFLSNQPYKKKPILIGINVRILSLFGLGFLMLYSPFLESTQTLWLIIFLLGMFSLGGAYAGISYTDILGKSILAETRKSFFSIRQLIMGFGAFISVVLVAKLLVWKEYPLNYSYMLFGGFLWLFIASLGFWRLKEVVPSGMVIQNTRHFLKVIRTELTINPGLKYFLGYINTLGLSLAFLPFVILYAKTQFQTDAGDTGGFLIFKVIGMVTTSLLIFLLSKKIRYRYLLYHSSILAMILPILLLFPFEKFSLNIVFLIGGVVIAIYNIAMNGVLLELSGNQNRTIYAGIVGAGNILPVLFPLVSGWVIQQFGFDLFFIIYLIIIISSFFFIYKLDCKR